MRYIKLFEEFVQNNIDNIVSILVEDCKPYIDKLKSENKDFFYRGYKREIGNYMDIDGIHKLKTRKDRTPKDTNIKFINELNEEFINMFGFELRKECVFATKNIKISEDYGKKYIFFPIGDFNVYYNPVVQDLYTDIRDEVWYLYYSNPIELKLEYDYLFGEDNGNGYYVYINKPLNASDRFEAIENLRDMFPELEDENDKYLDSLISWKPTLTYDEYYKEIEQVAKNKVIELARGYIKNPSFGDILERDLKAKEVCFECNGYYLIEYSKEIEKELKNKLF